jgi:hypothetical protein
LTPKLTYDLKGVKDVPIKVTNGFRLNFTIVLAVNSLGMKLPPYVISENSQISASFSNPYPEVSIIRKNAKGWINYEYMIDYFKRIILNLKISESDELRLFFVDAWCILRRKFNY